MYITSAAGGSGLSKNKQPSLKAWISQTAALNVCLAQNTDSTTEVSSDAMLRTLNTTPVR
jgi:hypothetical protein